MNRKKLKNTWNNKKREITLISSKHYGINFIFSGYSMGKVV